jgi:hypothetical protein
MPTARPCWATPPPNCWGSSRSREARRASDAPWFAVAGGRCRPPPGGRANGGGAGLSDAARASGRRLSRRRSERHSRAADRTVAVGSARSAVHGREPARRLRQYRHRSGRARARRRLHATTRRSRQRDRHFALYQSQLQLPARHRAGRQHHPRTVGHGGPSRYRRRRLRSSSPMRRRMRARSRWRRPATAARRMCRASCSR